MASNISDATRLAHDISANTLIDLVRELVEVESPSTDTAACDRCLEVLAGAARRLWDAEPEVLRSAGHAHLRLRTGGAPRIALLGHLDTVWPLGTLQRIPFSVRDGVARGPGVFDMKAGLVMALHAVALLQDPQGIELLVTSDEELGSPTSRELIEDLGRRVEAVLVLEPAQDDAVKTARKGVSQYRIDISGRAAHAGLEPQKGVNALLQLARTVLETESIADPAAGTTVTPTVASAGTVANVVPAQATVAVDVRATSIAEQERVDAAMRALRASLPGAGVHVQGGPNRPPLEETASQALYQRLRDLASRHGFGELRAVAVGGGSDGNFTAALGTPTLDGLGAVGDGAHAEHEHVRVDSLLPRTRLLALLLDDLLRRPLQR